MRVLNYGSLGIDYVFSVEHFVRPGETLMTGSRAVFPGGKGLNQSIALAKAGAPVCQAGAVGVSDGQFLIDILEENGIDCGFVERNQTLGSQCAVIQVTPEGQNSILLYGGANRQISREAVDRALGAFGKGDWLVLQNEISRMPEILRLAGERGMRIVLNPSPLSPDLPDYPLEYVEMFLLNEIEGQELSGCAGKDRMIYALQARFPRAKIILTLGEEGCQYLEPGMAQALVQPAFPVKAVDSTAAGDTFTGYVLGSLMEGKSVAGSLRTACAAAAISVTRPGASASIPERSEVEAFLREH